MEGQNTISKAISRRNGLFFTKEGMTTLWTQKGAIPVTVLKLLKQKVVTLDNGVVTIAVEHGGKLNKPQFEELNKHGIEQKTGFTRKLRTSEVLDAKHEFNVDFFQEEQYVDVQGTNKGKGFQGVIKRWNFKGGRASHGNSLSHRSAGSTGTRKVKTKKGKKMAGHMGNETCTQQGLKVMGLNQDLMIVLVKGSVPGPKKGLLYVKDAIKRINGGRKC